MKLKQLLLILFCFSFFNVFGQESNGEKEMWAKSFLNQKAPELVVETWVSKKPKTTGKFVLIDFWATWCAPCRKAIPELNSFQKKFASNLVVIGISKETEEKVKSLKTPQMDYASAIDTKGTTSAMLEVKGIPHCILIDPYGIVRWEGYPLLENHELTERVLGDLIKKYK